MDAIVLAGGFGTRLQSISNNVPKTLMPAGDGCYLDFLLERLFQYNISHVYLSVHYKYELFQDYVMHAIYGNKLTTVIEPEPLGTGGAINYVIENSSITSPFFVINGDSLSNIDLNQMNTEFEIRNSQALIGISSMEDSKRYGKVVVENKKVISFKEKGVVHSGWINNGHYLLKKDVFCGYSGHFSIEEDLFPKLVKNNELDVFKVIEDDFIDIGVPEDYLKFCKIIKPS